MPTDFAAEGAPFIAPTPVARAGATSNPGTGRKLKVAAVAGAGVAALVVATGVMTRGHEAAGVKAWTSAQSIPPVSLVSPTPEAGAQSLVLPGNLQAYYNAQIFSRVPGYVHAWYRDIGARVKAGELLATIDTPELDQQLVQARADIESAEANRDLAATTARRWTSLLSKDAVSAQETDEKTSDFKVKTAQVDAAEANLHRLEAMKAFARIVAPFDGVVTARRTDIGALVNVGSSTNATAELFDVAKVDPLRLYVRVPQSYSARIKPDTKVTLTVPEYPGRIFQGQFTSTANAVSDQSGTLLVELSVQNPDGVLKSGDYAQVRFELPDGAAGGGGMRVPSSALLFRHSGLVAAVVGPDNRARLRHVTAGRDLGPMMEISSGLNPGDKIIDNPPDSLADGQLVRVVSSTSKSPESVHAPN